MIPSILDMFSFAFSVTGIFGLWHGGIKPLLLSNFRDNLFIERDRLYALGNEGRLAYDSEAYRRVEFFLNCQIQYAYRISFVSLLFAHLTFDQTKVWADGQTPAEVLERRINGVQDVAVRDELQGIVDVVNKTLLPRYIAKSSVFFLILSAIYFIVTRFTPLAVQAFHVKSVTVATFEEDAYRESRVDLAAAAC